MKASRLHIPLGMDSIFDLRIDIIYDYSTTITTLPLPQHTQQGDVENEETQWFG